MRMARGSGGDSDMTFTAQQVERGNLSLTSILLSTAASGTIRTNCMTNYLTNFGTAHLGSKLPRERPRIYLTKLESVYQRTGFAEY